MKSASESIRRELVLVFLVALGALVLEVGLTRVFSFKLYYYFTYLILGLALLGLGTGGVFVAIFPSLREVPARTLAARCLALTSVAVPCSYFVIALVQLNVSGNATAPGEILKLLVISGALFAPFLLVGIVLASVFGQWPEQMNRLYFSDLLGAGLGCAICIPLFLWLTPPGAVVATGAIFGVSAFVAAEPSQKKLLGVAGVASLLALGLVGSASLPDPVPDAHKFMSPQKGGPLPRFHSEWSSVFRVDVLGFPGHQDRKLLNHDGNIGSSLLPWDGELSSLSHYANSMVAKPFSVLPQDADVLIIGSAGGQELQASLYLTSGRVTGVELNPVTVSLLEEHFADYTGRVAHHERVRLINAEGRSFIERSDEQFDLIWMVAPDSYAAMNAASSGAFVLSESYLYTVEMMEAALDRLAPGGVLAAQFGELHLRTNPNRTPRFLLTAREAMRRRGITDFHRHVLASFAPNFLPGSTLLLSNEPFSTEQIERFRSKVDDVEEAFVFHPLERRRKIRHPVELAITLRPEGVEKLQEIYPYDISPIYDDSPFFWHFTPFWNAITQSFEVEEGIVDHEVATGERTLLMLLAFATSFALVFILLPTFRIRDVWARIPNKLNVGVYFAALGLAFMFIEVGLIQKLTLFLGYPSYSLTVTLFSLLVFSGLGSLWSKALFDDRNRALWLLMAAVGLLVLAMQFALDPIVGALWDTPLPARIAIASILTAPVGLCLGCFMPVGIDTVAALAPDHEREYVAWAWAVNGFFSVVSSVLATILSMTVGFRWLFFIAFCVYAIGIVSLMVTPAPRRPSIS